MGFARAVKHEAKLRLALAGPAGSGKTYTALQLARELVGEKPVAVIDTERGSASKYADLFEFDVLELNDFDPDRYTAAIADAVNGGYGVVVVDSLSHAWNGRGGLLEQVERIAKLRHGGNTFKAWGDGEIRRKEQALIEALTGASIHIIATMRTKTEYVVETNDKGKSAPRKVGTAPIQRDGFEYEFDVFGEMTADNELIVQKTRCPALTGEVISKPGKAMAATLRTWLAGAPTAPTPSAQPERSERDERAATPVQRSRIANACKLLGRTAPELHDYEHAETVLAALTQEYRELQAQQAQQPAQPAATPDLADLPMARGGRH